ncbi:hypothetical protein [Alsobacter metallidurans]|nr:hypothetical protein [Alsobacter metallidurans]
MSDERPEGSRSSLSDGDAGVHPGLPKDADSCFSRERDTSRN